ncbi:hypothetical protein [Brachybacterium sp. NPDC056505]|uniref:hypothetical protein n=1 Tax=Brachybacterium sp. NPDC056505 TaxID=3345843 RepID=UPI00366FE55D
MTSNPTPDLSAIPFREDGTYTPAERLQIVVAARFIAPAEPRQAGIAGAFTGKTTPGTPSVDDTLRIARFVTEPWRDLPGVDESWEHQVPVAPDAPGVVHNHYEAGEK